MMALISAAFNTARGYLILAAVIGAIGFVGAVYVKGRVDASHKAEMTSIKLQLAHQEATAIAARQAYLADAEKAKAFAAENAALEILIDELEVQGSDNQCLGAPSVERLRQLWEKAYGRP
jgi:hypothetical protein